MQKSDFVSITIIKLYFYNQIIYLSIVCMLCFFINFEAKQELWNNTL